MTRSAAALLGLLLLHGCGGSSDPEDRVRSDQAVAFQIDAAHTGVSGVVAPAFPASAAWTATFAGQLSYPLIAGGKVYVVEAADFSTGSASRLHALDRGTGATAWGPVSLPGTGQTAGHAFDGGKLFIATFDGLVLSFDAATGQPGWSTKLPQSYGFVTVPTATGGTVYLGDGGSNRIVALSEANGVLLWSTPVNGGGFGTPSVAGSGVYVAYPCQTYRLAIATGAEVWHNDEGCSGGGGATAPVVDDRLYVRGFDFVSTLAPFIDARNATTGTRGNRYASVGSFTQAPIPALATDAVYLLDNATLRRFDPALGAAAWSFAGDGTLVTPPIVVGSAVIVGAKSGMLYAVDGKTGAQTWSVQLPSGIDDNNDASVLMPSGLAAGEGMLVVPSRHKLTAFRLAP